MEWLHDPALRRPFPVGERVRCIVRQPLFRRRQTAADRGPGVASVGLVRLLAAVLLLACASPVSAQVDRWNQEIADAAARFSVPETWIRRVMAAESGGRLLLA